MHFINVIYYSDNFSCALVLKESKATRPAAANPDIFQLLGLLQDFDVNWQPLNEITTFTCIRMISQINHINYIISLHNFKIRPERKTRM